MKKSLHALLVLALCAGLPSFARAQTSPAPKIATVNVAKIFESYYKKQAEEAKLRADEQKAEAEIQSLVKEGNGLVDSYKELAEQAKNPALTAEARAKADDDVKKKMGEIDQKRNEIQTFQNNVRQEFQQRVATSRGILIEEIDKVATSVANRKGITLLLDKSVTSAVGAPCIIYADSTYDITDEVQKEVNKDRPATLVPAATETPAAPAAGDDAAKVSVPGLTPNN